MNLAASKVAQFGRLLMTFLWGQGLTQVLQLVTGFLLVNWMTKDSYADYTLVLAILGASTLLIDLGISQTLIGLIGKDVANRVCVGRYLAACRYYRDRLLLVGVVGLLAVFLFFGSKYDWALPVSLFLWACVSFILFSQVVLSTYRPLLVLEKRLSEMYTVTIKASAGRLCLIVLSYVMGAVYFPVVVLISAVRESFEAFFQWRLTRNQVTFPPIGADLSEEKKEILGQSVPRVPSLMFTAFSGQFIVFAMGIFGTRAGLAEIGALGRLAMIFVIFNKAGGVLIAPHFARMNRDVLMGNTRGLLLVLTCGMIGVASVVYAFPHVLLFVLGDGYQHLESEVFLVVVAALLRVTSMLLFSVCLARKYVFSWYSAVDVLPQVGIITLFISYFDLSVLTNLLYFGIAMSASKLFSKMSILWIGMARELR